MKLRLVSGIMVALLIANMLTLTFNVQVAEAEPVTIIVPDDYAKIQWAVGNASDGDTIFVKNGTYYEQMVVNKTLSLIGENKK
ncbi:MAG: hypothetical protein JSV12_00190 [Candidatus Bathyarchaeota archaeon]|nr:MAG: hypothetical protein JSV12_00190 [Candidatus Bathyarchaeota archaeon]